MFALSLTLLWGTQASYGKHKLPYADFWQNHHAMLIKLVHVVLFFPQDFWRFIITTLCTDNIIMMLRFVELCHDIIGHRWNLYFNFLSCDKIKCVVQHPDNNFCSMSDEQRQCSLCLWLFFGEHKLPYADFWQNHHAMLIKLVHVVLYFPQVLWKEYMFIEMLWQISSGFPQNCGFTNKHKK